MKYLTLLILALLSTISKVHGQDWKPYNDTLIYYYQASNTGDYFTLRTETKTVIGDETHIQFVDNIIPCDTIAHPDGHQLYYDHNGSVLGDSMVVLEDNIWIDNTVQFTTNMTLGDTLPFSITAGTEITYLSAVDTIIFDTPDSVKYYVISDGTQLIQSKNFGLIHYPKQNSDSLITYELVGIENIVGLSFDHHNEIFDFEIGDKFYYYNSYFSVFFDVWGSNYSTMRILDKHEIDGRYYYNVNIDGNYIADYPRTYGEDPPFDHPGETVQYCRGCDGISSIAFPQVMQENNEYFSGIRLGHNYTLSPESGNILQVVGFGSVEDSYTTLGFTGSVDWNTTKHYNFYPSDEAELLKRISGDYYHVVYEEGLGMVFFDGSGFEDGHTRKLKGAIKSGDTLGVVDLSIIEQELNDFNLYPNPSEGSVSFDQDLSQIKVFDLLGNQVLFIEETCSLIDLGHLESGNYLIVGISISGVLKSARIVKN
jgi:hypothetical protein